MNSKQTLGQTAGHNEILTFYKQQGETPLEALERLRIERPEFKDERLSYAGRLDPMAEGVMLVLIGDANNKREEYLKLSKEYEVEILFGITTDTYDILGLITEFSDIQSIIESKTDPNIERVLQEFVGTHEFPYPAFSSQPVYGKPLFQWAKEGRLGEISIPTRPMTFSSITIIEQPSLNSHQINIDEIYKKVEGRIKKVSGDFRQNEVLESWKKTVQQIKTSTATKDFNFPLLKIRVECESGAYMRTLAYEIGRRMNIPTLAWSIIRTKVGTYKI